MVRGLAALLGERGQRQAALQGIVDPLVRGLGMDQVLQGLGQCDTHFRQVAEPDAPVGVAVLEPDPTVQVQVAQQAAGG